MQDLIELLKSARILVVGDVMLDRYIIGRADRISPEAPIPVLKHERTELRLGGAGAVAAMCRALGARVDLATVIGDDAAGKIVMEMLRQQEIGTSAVLTDPERCTTEKIRVVGVSGNVKQQLQRIDCESTDDAPQWVAQFFSDWLRHAEYDAILVSDYAKGFCSPAVLTSISGQRNVIVDPPRHGWKAKYTGRAGCFVPNRIEAGGPVTQSEIRECGATLRESLSASAVILKLDSDGCCLFTAKGSQHWETAAREVVDVCGAGDQFLAALGCVRAIGGSWDEACYLANAAAGLQVQRFGCDPVSAAELMDAMPKSLREVAA